jgi:hypothetical protein
MMVKVFECASRRGKLCHFETSADPTQQKFPPKIHQRYFMGLVPKPNHSPEAQRIDCRLQPTCTLRAAQNCTLNNVRLIVHTLKHEYDNIIPS